jgi:peptidoglycan/LPS O-acetylase OafA/YrhL
MVKKEGRLVSIDLLRVIAIFLIIGFHVSYELKPIESFRYLGFVGVSLFFIISGFILAKKHPHLHKISIKWILKRWIKVASVYYIAIVGIVIFFGTQVYSGKIMDILLHFLFLDPFFKSSAYSIISPAWFLTPLIALYIVFPYLNRWINKTIYFLPVAFLVMVLARIFLGGLINANPLFFIGEFCFGIAFAHGKKHSALLLSFITIFIMPIMFLPFILFYLLYFIKTEYLPSKILHFIGINTFFLFLYHEAFMKVILGRWHIFKLNTLTAVLLIVALVVFSAYISKKIQDYLFSHKFFLGPLYKKSF